LRRRRDCDKARWRLCNFASKEENLTTGYFGALRVSHFEYYTPPKVHRAHTGQDGKVQGARRVVALALVLNRNIDSSLSIASPLLTVV
jgi:hypothetical protein